MLSSMLPPNTRRITRTWFDVIADVTFLRLTYLHFHKDDLPSWTNSDALLAQRLDCLSGDIVKLLEEIAGAANGDKP